MFASSFGQGPVIEQLRSELLNQELPQALLFYGQRYSGRMTAALETARILHCREGAAPACKCRECRTSRTLDNPYTMVFANRDFLSQFDAASAGFAVSRNQESRDLLRRSVNLLLKRFDVMWAGKHDSQQKESSRLIEEIQDQLAEFSSLDDRLVSKQEGVLAKIRKLTAKLDETIKSGNLPVQAVRSLQSWLSTKPGDFHGTVIMEGVEYFHDPSKNALLKFLEEPPKNVTAVLLSEGRGRIIPTILSRVRTYAFLQRSPEEDARVIRDVYYHDPDEFDSLRTFFLTKGGIDCRTLRDDMQFLVNSLVYPDEFDHDRFIGLLARIDEQGMLKQAFLEIIEVLRECRDSRLIDGDLEYRCWEVISEAGSRSSEKHQRESLILESCWYKLAELFNFRGVKV